MIKGVVNEIRLTNIYFDVKIIESEGGALWPLNYV